MDDDKFTEESLRDLFKEYGTLTSVHLAVDGDSKLSRGFGFVNFASREDAERSMAKLQGRPIDGKKPLFVAWHERKDARGAREEALAAQLTELNIYAKNYNVFRVMSGMGGLAFAN
jgi:hypothetical protein